MTEQIESTKVVGLAERILTGRIVGNGEELGRHDLPAVFARETLEMICVP